MLPDMPWPVDAFVAVTRSADSSGTVWSVLVNDQDGRPAVTTGFHAHAPIARDQAVQALLAALSNGQPADVYTSDTQVHAALVQERVSMPWMEPHPVNRALTHSMRRPAHEYAVKSGPAKKVSRLTVAVDGSWSRGTRTGGWSYLTADGRWGVDSQGHVHDSLEAELRAIRLLLTQQRQGALLIETDCASALDVISSKSSPAHLVRLVSDIRSLLEGRDVSFEWVPAHSGMTLNEGADRLAVTARRSREAAVAPEVRAKMLERIVDETTQAAATGAVLQPSRRPVPKLLVSHA